LFFLNYPNPFSSETTFSFNSTTAPNEIEIFDLNGQKIVSLNICEGKPSISLNTEKFSDGVYIAQLLSNNNIIATKKLVKMK
ncbi:MAG TPA: T9SS type A sorting domain-containing protein, partial [Flavobacteriaceae bacterium]|nr:T9SS type A sorting domain-containing protein [Flavobacteriaceae bacterium]